MKTEQTRAGDIVRSEQNNYASRRVVRIAAAAGVLLAGTILGEVKIGTITQAFVGTGNGTLTAVSAGKNAVPGDYVLLCIAAAANAATFSVVTPTGQRLNDATLGAAYTSDFINFQLNDGATDFTVGAKFTVTMPPGSGEFKKAVRTAGDGSQKGAAILLQDVDATDGAVDNVLVLEKIAQVDASAIAYDASFDTDARKAALRADLEANHIDFIASA